MSRSSGLLIYVDIECILLPPLASRSSSSAPLPLRSVARPPLSGEARWLCVHPPHDGVAFLVTPLGVQMRLPSASINDRKIRSCQGLVLVVRKVRDNSDHGLVSFRYDRRRFDTDNHSRPGRLRSWLLARACFTCASFIHPGCGGLIGAVDCAKFGTYRWVAAAANRYPWFSSIALSASEKPSKSVRTLEILSFTREFEYPTWALSTNLSDSADASAL